jgi:hypothetical protein
LFYQKISFIAPLRQKETIVSETSVSFATNYIIPTALSATIKCHQNKMTFILATHLPTLPLPKDVHAYAVWGGRLLVAETVDGVEL